MFKELLSKRGKFVPISGKYPKGYLVGAVSSGIKKTNSLDLSLIYSKTPCNAAGVFTTNKFPAAPVLLSKEILKATGGKNIHSVVINSGCANSVTGDVGMKDARATLRRLSEVTHQAVESALVMSTGVIGQYLPIDKIYTGLGRLFNNEANFGDTHNHWICCAKGIMTTDTFPKLVSKSFKLDGREYRIAGISKGAGMIAPNMATLLGAFVTDAPISQPALASILQYATDRSYNCISVDGDMSTNDTIIALANGAAGGPEITSESKEYVFFRDSITEFAQTLSQLVVRDGEGATKFVTIHVKDCSSYEIAKTIASTVANSPLVKTALYGHDANWGRILCAIGYAKDTGEDVIPENTSVSFVPDDGSAPLELLVNGQPKQVDEDRAKKILREESYTISIDIGTGKGVEAYFWTCDLSHDYITINGLYRS